MFRAKLNIKKYIFVGAIIVVFPKYVVLPLNHMQLKKW